MGSVGRLETSLETQLAFAREEIAILKGQLAATVEFYRSLPECKRENRCVSDVPLRLRGSCEPDPRDREIADLRSELAATRRRLAAAESWAREAVASGVQGFAPDAVREGEARHG